jgi:chromosome segregation ATPase
VRELKREIGDLEEQLKSAQKELDLLGVQEKALGERIKDLEAQKADSQQMDPAHLAKLEKQVKQFKKEHGKAAEAAGEVQLEVQRSV